MRPSQSQAEFLARIGKAGLTLNALKTEAAVGLMASFYKDQRAEGCRLEQQGDMLLYQWGTYSFGPPETFQLDLTRQFVEEAGEEDPPMSQLSLTVHYLPTPELRALGTGNRWCEHPDLLPDFERFIQTSEAYRQSGARAPARVTLDWGLV